MDRIEHLAALRRDGEAFSDACRAAGPGAPVASCPGWTVADLQWHLAEVHDFWRTIVHERLSHWDQYTQPGRPADEDLDAFYRAGLDALVAVLEAADPAAEVWTWSSDQTASFVIRRMAQETAVHRWDAERAAGRDVAIDGALASDGIDEFLTHFVANPAEGASLAGSVHIHCTDVPGEWTTRAADGGLVTTREHAKGDCALRGPAGELLLVLWRRIPLSALDVVGDAAVAAQFVAYTGLE